ARYSRGREWFVFATTSTFLNGREANSHAYGKTPCKITGQREAGRGSFQTATDRQCSGRLVALAGGHSLSSALDRTKLPRGRLRLVPFRTQHHRSLYGEPA